MEVIGNLRVGCYIKEINAQYWFIGKVTKIDDSGDIYIQILDTNYDVICITSLFTNDVDKVIKSINEVKNSLFANKATILIGGIAASLMKTLIKNRTGIDTFYGISKILDKCIPDYSIDWDVSVLRSGFPK